MMPQYTQYRPHEDDRIHLLDLTMRLTIMIIAGRLIRLDRYIQFKADRVKIYILVSLSTVLFTIVPTASVDRTNILV